MSFEYLEMLQKQVYDFNILLFEIVCNNFNDGEFLECIANT